MFASLGTAQAALDEWVDYYNTQRPHQALDDQPPLLRFERRPLGATTPALADPPPRSGLPDRTGPGWVTRKVCSNGVVCVAWQQVSVGVHHAGQRCDVFVAPDLLQLWVGEELLKTVTRTSTGEVRKKRAAGTGKRA